MMWAITQRPQAESVGQVNLLSVYDSTGKWQMEQAKGEWTHWDHAENPETHLNCL